jgi:hypothetical protein
VEIVIWCLTVVPGDVNAMLPAFKVPAPTARVLPPEELVLGIVTAPETVKVIPELMLNKVVPLEVVKSTVAHAALAVTVTAVPAPIITASLEVGVVGFPEPLPDRVQVPELLQFPVAEDVKVQADTLAEPRTVMSTVRNSGKIRRCGCPLIEFPGPVRPPWLSAQLCQVIARSSPFSGDVHEALIFKRAIRKFILFFMCNSSVRAWLGNGREKGCGRRLRVQTMGTESADALLSICFVRFPHT